MRPVASGGVGAAVRRREDGRFLRGRGEFVADIKRFGMREVAFLRSPVAHGRIRHIGKPAHAADRVFTAADLAGVSPIRADSGLPGFKSVFKQVQVLNRQAGVVCSGAGLAADDDLVIDQAASSDIVTINLPEKAPGPQVVQKALDDAPRAERVRTRRPDAHLEHIERADRRHPCRTPSQGV